MNKKNPAALLGRKGGAVKSEAKSEAARANGKKGGRPPKEKTPGETGKWQDLRRKKFSAEKIKEQDERIEKELLSVSAAPGER